MDFPIEFENLTIENIEGLPKPEQLDLELPDDSGEIELDLELPDDSGNWETTEYKDDGGIVYKVGNELLPDINYELNGYSYQTDGFSRIVSAEGTLQQKDHEGRLPLKDSIEIVGRGEAKDSDDRGHLIGDQFNGANDIGNLVAQDARVNRNDVKNLENELARCVEDGKDVQYKVDVLYEGESGRPAAFVISYSVDGIQQLRIFSNA